MKGNTRFVKARRRSLTFLIALASSVITTAAFAQILNLTVDGSTSKTVGAGSQFTLQATLSPTQCQVTVPSPTQCVRQCFFPQPRIRIDATSPVASTISETFINPMMSDAVCDPTFFPPTQTATVSKAQGSGDYQFQASIDGSAPISNFVTVSVLGYPTTTSASIVGTPTAGAVGVAASVQPQNGGPNPTGTVQFTAVVNGSTFSTVAPLSGRFASGTLSLPASTVPTTVTATYSGDPNLTTSWGQVTIPSIAKANSSTSQVTTAPTCVPLGGPVTLSATVTGYSPNGRVDFLDGTTVVASATATNTTNTNGSTTFIGTGTLGAGVHNLVASYVGDSNNLASTSPVLPKVPGIFTKGTWDYSVSGSIGGINGYTHYHVDLNGDGKADWIQIDNAGNAGYVSLSGAAGVPGILLPNPQWDYSSPGIGAINAYAHYFADLDGDGRPDWIQVYRGGNLGWVSLSSVSGAPVPGILLPNGSWTYSVNGAIGSASAYTHYQVDLNGDGKADWIQIYNGGNAGFVSLSRPSSVAPILLGGVWDYSSPYIGAASAYTHYFADLDGDGRKDWIQVYDSANYGWVSLSSRSGAPVPGILANASWDYSMMDGRIGGASAYTHYFVDLDGDGKADWIQIARGSNNAYVGLSRAYGLASIIANGTWTNPLTDGRIGGTDNYTHYFVDVNGDGKLDWVQVANGSNNAWISLSDTSGLPGIITRGLWDYQSPPGAIGGINGYAQYLVDFNGDHKAEWVQVAHDFNSAQASFAPGSVGSCP